MRNREFFQESKSVCDHVLFLQRLKEEGKWTYGAQGSKQIWLGRAKFSVSNSNHLDTVLESTANDASKNKEASNYGWVEQNVVSKNQNVPEFVLESTANDESDNKDWAEKTSAVRWTETYSVFV